MKYPLKLAPLTAIALSASLLAAQSSEAKHAGRNPRPGTTADSEPGAKTIHYGYKDVVKLNTKVRFTTLIELPKDEQILDFVCGDKDLWVLNGNQNFAYIKPAKEGTTTNRNLITASGNIYSFLLVEIYRTAEAPAAHKQTHHYQKWAETVSGMMAAPRSSVKFTKVYPEDGLP